MTDPDLAAGTEVPYPTGRPRLFDERARLGSGPRQAKDGPLRPKTASNGQASCAVGADMPLVVTALAPETSLIVLVALTSLLFLALLGGLAARAGGASILTGAVRVTFWGALAMGVPAGVGALFGTVG